MAPEPDGVTAPTGRSAGRRWLWLTLVVAFVAWNAVYDIVVNRGLDEYVERHARYVLGLGPRVTIRGVMAVAVSRGAWLGSGAAAVVLAAAAVVAWGRGRRSTRGRSRSELR